jgi:hypothetical protein
VEVTRLSPRPFRFGIQHFGAPEEVAEQLIARRARFGVSYWVITAPSAAAFAPVVRLLAGT